MYPERIQLCMIPSKPEYSYLSSTFLRECKKIDENRYKVLCI